MISILAIGDPHAKLDNSLEIRMLKDKLVDLIVNKSPDVTVIMGDLSHYFSRMYNQPWLEIIDFIDGISKVSSSTYYIIGNHDLINNTQFLSKNHFFSVFQNWKGRDIQIVDDRVVEIRPGIIAAPYVYPGRFIEMLELHNVDLTNTKAIFCHQEFRDAKMGAVLSKKGDVWHPDLPMVYSGHIHDRDVLQKNIVYVGSPYQVSFGDNSAKTVEMIEIWDGGQTSVPVDLGMPKKKTVKVDAAGFKSFKVTDSMTKYRVIISDLSESLHKIKKTKKYKDLSKTIKIILRPTDTFKKKSVLRQCFGQIMDDLIIKESECVQTEYAEVMANVSKN